MKLCEMHGETEKSSGVQTKNACRKSDRRLKSLGDDLLSHKVTQAVPSAQWGLTTLFGMERGVAPTQ